MRDGCYIVKDIKTGEEISALIIKNNLQTGIKNDKREFVVVRRVSQRVVQEVINKLYSRERS